MQTNTWVANEIIIWVTQHNIQEKQIAHLQPTLYKIKRPMAPCPFNLRYATYEILLDNMTLTTTVRPWFLILGEFSNYTHVNMMFRSFKKNRNISRVGFSIIAIHVRHILHTCKCIWIRLSVFPNCTSLLEIRVMCPRFPIRGACLPVEGNVGCTKRKNKWTVHHSFPIQVRNNNSLDTIRCHKGSQTLWILLKYVVATTFTSHHSITLESKAA